MTYLGEGWDSTAFLVGGRWVERRPRRPEIGPQLVRETVVMPWLAIQAGLRFKPHRNFAARFDVGIGLGQVFFGLGADYGL